MGLVVSELNAVSHHNRSLQARAYICLKCSRTFVSEPPSAYGSGLDSYAFQGGQFSPGAIYGLGTSTHQDKAVTSAQHPAVTCSCGSDMIMETDRQTTAKQSLFSIGEEAVDALDGEIGKPPHQVGSMAWMGGLSSVNEAMENAASALHVSGSLPSNLASVVMKPVDSDTKNQEIALSNPSVDVSAPFKTFSHLLTPHDLYKLVNVTPSVSVLMSTKPTLQAGTLNPEQSAFETPSMDHRHMRENKSQQRVVTSTPRRKHPEGASVTAMSENDFSYKGVSHIDTMKTSRALNFTKSFSTALAKIEYYPADKSDETDFATGIRLEQNIPPSLLHFIEDELLDPGEDLVAVVQTSVASSSGKNVLSYANAAKKSTKKNLFASPQGKANSPKQSAFIGREMDCLLLLTTMNVHILKITSKISGILTPDILECIAMHSLTQISKLETGLCDTALYFAVADINNKKKTMTVDNLTTVYAVNIRSSAKCKRLHMAWNETIFNGYTSDYQSDISAKNIATQNVFSDALEKEFSEHVLLFLDLNVLTVKDSENYSVITDRLFGYFPCWMLNDSGEDTGANIVLSCGGSLALFSEDQGIILNEYARAICRAVGKRPTGPSRERASSINSNSSQHSWVSPMQNNSPLTPTFTHNVYSTVTQRHCKDITHAWLFRDNPLMILLSFNNSSESNSGDWQLTFPCEATFKEFTDYVMSYKFVLTESSMDVQWK